MFGFFGRKKQKAQFLKMMKDIQVGEERSKVSKLLLSLDEDFKPVSEELEYCVDASNKILWHFKSLVEDNPDEMTERAKLVLGLFAFVYTSHLSRILDVPFEPVTYAVIPTLFVPKDASEEDVDAIVDEAADIFDRACDEYNCQVEENNKIQRAIGQNFYLWVETGHPEPLQKLVQLYTIMKQPPKNQRLCSLASSL